MTDASEQYVELSESQALAVRAAITERMESDPDLTLGAIQRRGNVSQPTVTDVLAGKAKRYWRSSLRKVSIGVGWTPLSIEQILDGGGPTMAEDHEQLDDDRAAELAEDVKTLRAEVASLRALIERLDKSPGDAQGADGAR